MLWNHRTPHRSARAACAPSLARALLACAALGCVPRGSLDEYSSGEVAGAGGSGGQPAAGGAAGTAPGGPVPDAGSAGGAPPSAPGDAAAAPAEDAGAPPGGAGGADDVPSSPRILATVPADGAFGVRRDTTLSIAFDVPMDRASVEAAFSFDGLAEGTPEFRWDAAGMLLNVVLEEPLSYATGSDPAVVVALRYGYRLSSAARDADGNELPETRVTFSTLRELSVQLSAQSSSTATGNWRSDGVYGTDPCHPAGASMCIGDSSFGPNAGYRGFVTFDLSVLPDAALELTRAELGLQATSLLGTPSPDLGALLLEHVRFAAIGPDAFLAASQAQLGSVASVSASSTLSLDVLPAARSDWLAALPSQYRLRFQSATDGDGATDLLFASRASASLAVSYLLP